MSMYDNDPAGYKNTANTTGAQDPLTAKPRNGPALPEPRVHALQNLDGDLVLTDSETPSSWLKTDPANAVDLEVMA